MFVQQALVTGALCLLAMPVPVQPYPTRPIRVIVPYAQGRRTGAR
jgi:tripartite-type tricarboxylate transporter receptor subunit TctC